MSHETLIVIWFILLGVLLVGYAILDGFDLGVGILHPFVPRTDTERRLMMNSIGPLWDGNEVWLITFGGALFAAFPTAYASIFSGFYTAFFLLLFALILRAVSLEFRSKISAGAWRRVWDYCFFVGSAAAALLFGVAVGNAMIGLPVRPNADIELPMGVLSLLRPYPLLVGLFTVAMFAMHGALYLILKTEGELRDRVRFWSWRCFGIFLVLFMLTTMYTLIEVDRATANFERFPWAPVVVVLNVLAIANIPRCLHGDKAVQAFLSSCASIAAFVFLFAIALFPNLVAASNAPELSLTIFNAASSEKTLRIMLIIAAVGLPFVLTYTTAIYWTFRGKTTLGEHAY